MPKTFRLFLWLGAKTLSRYITQGKMEWQLPIQKVEIGNINIGSPWARLSHGEGAQKPMAPLSYFGTQFRLPFVSLIFPPLPVIEYNASTGKLVLDMFESSLASIKLNTLQDTIVNAISYHQAGWFKSEFSKDDIVRGFQPIIQDNHLHLHCPSSASPSGASLSSGISIFKDGEWKKLSADDLKLGTRVRVAVKIHGISFLNRNDGDKWSGKCRLQHRILGFIAT
jgi:hypothetical protein